jgi:hypothetical protein
MNDFVSGIRGEPAGSRLYFFRIMAGVVVFMGGGVFESRTGTDRKAPRSKLRGI